ncbi:MAG: DUF4019 domain-containing protein [Brachymonas sp.]|nr:DUF4019 domain-containing protein [Brachymonas sp.]
MFTFPSAAKARTTARTTALANCALPRRLAVGLAAIVGALAGTAQAQQTLGDAFAPNTVLAAAQQTLQQVDAKQGNALHAQAPAFVKEAIKRNAFSQGIAQERGKLGAISARQWIGINRVVMTPAPNQAPVACANVRFVALQQNTPVGNEQVSLCWDQQQWRATGYLVSTP